GVLYKQFAVTVAISVIISGLVALTLTPALCALLLKPGDHESKLFRPFNTRFDRTTRGFLSAVNWTLRHRIAALLAFLGIIALAVLLFTRVPSSFVPPEDQGYVIAAIQLPDGATLQRTAKTGAAFQQRLSGHEAI